MRNESWNSGAKADAAPLSFVCQLWCSHQPAQCSVANHVNCTFKVIIIIIAWWCDNKIIMSHTQTPRVENTYIIRFIYPYPSSLKEGSSLKWKNQRRHLNQLTTERRRRLIQSSFGNERGSFHACVSRYSKSTLRTRLYKLPKLIRGRLNYFHYFFLSDDVNKSVQISQSLRRLALYRFFVLALTFSFKKYRIFMWMELLNNS